MSRHIIALLGTLTVAILFLPLVSAASPTTDDRMDGILPTPEQLVREARETAITLAQEVGSVVDETAGTQPGDGGAGDEPPARGTEPSAPGLAEGILQALGSPAGLAALAALGLLGLTGAGVLLATRYVDPKEALDNPQRSMLYGCIKGHPGVNLKQLSEDFDMKTSTVLWHIRKLEGAELVRSQKANGLRVFYPVEGGIAAKNLGAAVAALSNHNASTIIDYISIHPGTSQKGLVNALGVNPGTVRWHLRKLKEMGLMAELSHGRSCTYYPTDLGLKALKQTSGLSQDAKPIAGFVTEATPAP